MVVGDCREFAAVPGCSDRRISDEPSCDVSLRTGSRWVVSAYVVKIAGSLQLSSSWENIMRRFDSYLLVLLGLSLGLNVALALNWSRHRGVPAGPETGSLVGRTVPVIAGFALDGSRVAVDPEASRPVVVYAFSARCIWCVRNVANIKALVRSRGTDFRFVGLSVREDDDANADAVRNHLNFPVLKGLSAETRKAYGLTETPRTLLLVNGRVERDWRGAYVGDVLTDVQRYFSIELPGLTDDSAAVQDVPQAARIRPGECRDPDGVGFSSGAVWAINGRTVQCSFDGKWVHTAF